MQRIPSIRVAFVVIFVVGAFACGGRDNPTQPTGDMSQQARAYLDQLLGHMEANSINRLTINWSLFRTTVLAQGAGAQTIADTYPAIKVALEQLGDGHSIFIKPDGSAITGSTRTCTAPNAGTPTLPQSIGYVKVPAFSGASIAADKFAADIQGAIRSADREELVGWIVDVRGNGGGNMWPMIAGVGPVLGEGLVGYFIDPTGVANSWEYWQGGALLNVNPQSRVVDPYALRRPSPRVAVLTDSAIASSGEAVVIAFKGRPETRSFGDRTCGRSTANQRFSMSDGAGLNLTVSVMADRTRTKYGNSVEPDEFITDVGQLVARAISWLQTGS